jgi:flagellin
MALTINTNISSLNAQRNLEKSQNDLSQSMDRISSGSVNNRGATDSVALSTAAENLASAGSRLGDFDQAQGTMAMLKNSIYNQAGLALQTQANISPEKAFALLND